MGAFRIGNQVRVVVNHELSSGSGEPYDIPTVNDGDPFAGGRVSFLDIDAKTRKLLDAGLAYKLIRNRNGDIVREAGDLENGALDRLCSAQFFAKGTYGLQDDLFFTGEETDGGTEFVLNTKTGQLHAAPYMGRAAWESKLHIAGFDVHRKFEAADSLTRGYDDVVHLFRTGATMFDQPDENHIAVLGGDDRGGAPLILYIGEKRPGGFLARNGLEFGYFYVWVSADGTRAPNESPQLLGTFTAKEGYFKMIEHYQPEMAGEAGFDDLGFADQATQDALAVAAGAFAFSRPEDVSTNPDNGLQAILHSTGRSQLFGGVESWGQTLLIDVDFSSFQPGSDIPARVTIAYDGNDLDKKDNGIRSPDNGVWASDGLIYVQEDKSFGGFCLSSGQEASIWALNPDTSVAERIYQMDRSAVPAGQVDISPSDCGNWESSGVIEVTHLFDDHGCNPLLLANAQAHSLRFTDPALSAALVQGGQLFFLCKQA